MAATTFTVEPTLQLASVRCCANGALELLASMENGRRLFVVCSRCRVVYPMDRLGGLLERQDGAGGAGDAPASGRPETTWERARDASTSANGDSRIATTARA